MVNRHAQNDFCRLDVLDEQILLGVERRLGNMPFLAAGRTPHGFPPRHLLFYVLRYRVVYILAADLLGGIVPVHAVDRYAAARESHFDERNTFLADIEYYRLVVRPHAVGILGERTQRLCHAHDLFGCSAERLFDKPFKLVHVLAFRERRIQQRRRYGVRNALVFKQLVEPRTHHVAYVLKIPLAHLGRSEVGAERSVKLVRQIHVVRKHFALRKVELGKLVFFEVIIAVLLLYRFALRRLQQPQKIANFDNGNKRLVADAIDPIAVKPLIFVGIVVRHGRNSRHTARVVHYFACMMFPVTVRIRNLHSIASQIESYMNRQICHYIFILPNNGCSIPIEHLYRRFSAEYGY